MNAVIARVKPFAFTSTGAAVGAVAGGPVGLAFGAGLGALMDWWRKKNAPAAPPIAVAIVPPVPVLHLLPVNMQQQPFAPATLDAVHLQKLKMMPPPPKPQSKPVAKKPTPAPPPKVTPPFTAGVTITTGPAPKLTPPFIADVTTSDGSDDASASIDLSASGSFSL